MSQTISIDPFSLLQDEFFVRDPETQESDIIIFRDKCVPAVEPTYEYRFGPRGVN